jgi:hypothetical protein
VCVWAMLFRKIRIRFLINLTFSIGYGLRNRWRDASIPIELYFLIFTIVVIGTTMMMLKIRSTISVKIT